MFLAELHRNITGRLWRVVRIDSSITKDIHFVCLYGSLLAPIWGQVFVRPASNRHATQTTPSYQRLKTTTGGAAIGDGHRDICTLLAPPQLLEQYARKKLVPKKKKETEIRERRTTFARVHIRKQFSCMYAGRQ
jgi:hypothetical protein